MKKHLIVLLSLGIITTTNSSAMFQNLRHTIKKTFRSNNHSVTQTTLQNKKSENDFAVLELISHVEQVKENIVGSQYDYSDYKDLTKDPYRGYRKSPWHYYYIKPDMIEKSSIDSWIMPIDSYYKRIHQNTNEIDNIIPQLPSWSDKEHKIEFNNQVKRFINRNLEELRNYRSFLLQHHDKLATIKELKKQNNFLPQPHNILTKLEKTLKNELDQEAELVRKHLIHYNTVALDRADTLHCQLKHEIFTETDKRKKITSE